MFRTPPGDFSPKSGVATVCRVMCETKFYVSLDCVALTVNGNCVAQDNAQHGVLPVLCAQEAGLDHAGVL